MNDESEMSYSNRLEVMKSIGHNDFYINKKTTAALQIARIEAAWGQLIETTSERSSSNKIQLQISEISYSTKQNTKIIHFLDLVSLS